jgi:sialate O-acetylesterase
VKQFSAVCFYYGRQLYKHLGGKIPIGMIQSTWGGTYIESWSSPDVLKKCENVMKRSSDPKPNDPSALWNAMIHPLLNVNIKGFLWYQGEANWQKPEKYKCSFTEMINDYRLKWKIGYFEFYFVQLAAYKDPDGDPMNFKAIRLAQTVVLRLPNTGMATAVDLGDPESPFHPIHPRNKQEVAHRLFVIAAHFLYKSKIDYSGPLASSTSFVKENGVYSFRIMYSHINGGLSSRGSTFCVECCAKPETMFEFKVNDKWVAANELQLTNNYAIIKIKSEVKPSMIRYLWFDYPQCVVIDKNNDLPSPPFEMKV